jgi:hypothetical protein
MPNSHHHMFYPNINNIKTNSLNGQGTAASAGHGQHAFAFSTLSYDTRVSVLIKTRWNPELEQ